MNKNTFVCFPSDWDASFGCLPELTHLTPCSCFVQGFLEETSLFYGHYTIDGVKFQNFTYDLPLAYLISTIAYLALSLLWIVKR